MNGAPVYKLIQSVDPTKVNVPIRDRFAKLTLSSNKKKKDAAAPAEAQPEAAHQLEKRQSVSRNIMDLFTATEAEPHAGEKISLNPILRSEPSSKGTALPSDEVVKTEQPDPDETYCDTMDSSQSEFMEPLQLSADLTQQQSGLGIKEELVDKLSAQIQSLAVSSKPADVARAETVDNTICISSTSGEDDGSVGTSTEGAISISDSSHEDGPFEYELVTSQLPQSGRTADALLANTLSNGKADRLEAFLRDVSQQCHEMQRKTARGGLTSESPLAANKDLLETSHRSAKEIAAADTESMSTCTYTNTEAAEAERKLDTERQKRLLALQDTVVMSQSQASLFADTNDEQERRRSTAQGGRKDVDVAKRLAHNDTELNSQTSFESWHDSNSRSAASLSLSPKRPNACEDSMLHSSAHSAAPEDSVVISETSTEGEEAEEAEQASDSDQRHLVPSEERAAPEDDSYSSSDGSAAIQMGVTSINISAKINIKIQFSQDDSSPDEDGEDDEDDAESNEMQAPEATTPRPSLPASEEEATEVNECCERKKFVSAALLSPAVAPAEPTVKAADEDFITHAQSLLNQLYGKAWQTPEVIRALKRTSGSGGRGGRGGGGGGGGGDGVDDNMTRKKDQQDQVSETPKAIPKAASSRQPRTTAQADRPDEEDSMLDDFSIFRRNIEQTNLDSTRLTAAPKTRRLPLRPANINANAAGHDPHKSAVKEQQPAVASSSQAEERLFKVPVESARKIRGGGAGASPTKRSTRTKSGRVVKERWRRVIDNASDSEGDNASDDEDVDRTDADWCSDTSRTRSRRQQNSRRAKKDDDELVYLDLSHDEVTVLEGPPGTPPAENDEDFRARLQTILRTCRREDKPKLPATPQPQSKRKLFTPNFGFEEDRPPPDSPKPPRNMPRANDEHATIQVLDDDFGGEFAIFNKLLESVKTGQPVFKVTPPRRKDDISTTNRKTPATRDREGPPQTPKSLRKPSEDTPLRTIDKLCETPRNKYSFLKSLDACAGKMYCHPDALYYRENYRLKKDELSERLYELYNEKLFENKLNVPIVWNKKLLNTAGRCLNKKKFGSRSSMIELSEKVLTSADRLRCTLVHELCHAATWIFNGEGGHGAQWKAWARQANSVFPELPKIGVCHQYDIEYKYTYKCTLCGAKSHAHSKSKKVENIRCSFCHGAIEIFLNKKDKEGNMVPTPVKAATGFAKFVKDNYKQHKRPDLKHADVMKILSNEFAALKVNGGT